MKPVICKYCQQQFYKDKEEWVKISNRYAHASCQAEHEKSAAEYRKLTDLIQALYAPQQPNWGVIGKQLQMYKDGGKTWMGMYYTLTYFFVVQQNDIHKNAGVGIIPYVYDKAKAYYRNLDNTYAKAAEIEQRKNINIQQTENVISLTQSKPKKKLIDFEY